MSQKQTEFDVENGETFIPEDFDEEPFEVEEVENVEFDEIDREAIKTDSVIAARAKFEDDAISLNLEYADQLPKDLPIGLKQTLQNVPDRMKLPVICGILPLAAAYATNVKARYSDGKLQRLNMMSIIYGRQASGKSAVAEAVNLWVAPMKWQDEVGREEEESFRAKRKSRKANEKLPNEPKPIIREVPITISCSTLLKRLKNSQGQHLYSFGEELGTLQKTNGAGSWSSKYDIYRLSFDNGCWGQDYNSDNAESGVVNVAYNWSVLGTLGAVTRCFKADSIENGMCGRVLFAQMPSEFFAHMPVYKATKPIDGDKIIQAIEMLKAEEGELELPLLADLMREWVDKKADEARAKNDIALDTLRKRAAVIGFRAGVVYYLLQGKAKETASCLNFAELIANYCLANQISIFGTQLAEVIKGSVTESAPESKMGSWLKTLKELPATFTIDDILAATPGLTRRGASNNTARAIRKGWLKKLNHKTFGKTEEGMKI